MVMDDLPGLLLAPRLQIMGVAPPGQGVALAARS